MKQLTRIRLINWHLFENTTITCNGTTYLIGVNGVGKSTILDAVQFALVGGQRDIRFNQAAIAGGKRTLASYVRGELGTEGQRFLRDDATGLVALEFRNPDGSHFCHGAVIDAYADGRAPDVMYFIVHNALLDDAWFFREAGKLFDSRAFKRHLEHVALPPGGRAQLFSRVEDYRFHLLNRLGQLKDTFPAKIVKGLAFSPLTNIREFVHNYLLDENLVDVKTLQDQLETLRHFEALAINVKERIDALNRIEDLDQERMANRRRRLTNGYIQRRAQADVKLAQLKHLRQELDETRVGINRAALTRDAITEDLKRARQALLDAQVALQTDATAAREKELGEKIAALEDEVRALTERQSRANQVLAREMQAAHKLREFMQYDRLSIPPALDELINTPLALVGREAGGEGDIITRLQSDLEALGRAFTEQNALLGEQSRRLRQEADQVQREIAQLRTGDHDASYEAEAPEAARLRRLLRAELGLSAEEVPFLCTVLKVPDVAWQDAVEGVLGNYRFSLLVPPEHYDAAMRLYRERRHQDNLHGVGLPDVERILDARVRHSEPSALGGGEESLSRKIETLRREAAQGDGLAVEVETSHAGAQAFVGLILGNVKKCDSLEELREQRTAVTRECFLRRNYTTSHMNPRVYRRWFIGERAVPRQIEQRQARLEEIRAELLTCQDKANALRERLALTRDKARIYFDLERDLSDLTALPIKADQLAALQDELARLDLQTIAALRAEVAARQVQADQLQGELAQLERNVGGLEMRVKTLAAETIPSLEREADQVAQSAGEF